MKYQVREFTPADDRKERARQGHEVAHALLCEMLRQEFGIEGHLRLATHEHGKPYLPDHPHIHFNLSHCRTAVACAVSDRPVGIDIETLRPYRPAIARRTMNDTELHSIEHSPTPGLAFIRLWTQKEAAAKLTGTGLTVNLKELLTPPPRLQTLVTERYILSIAEEMPD